ncbi:MAG: S8 family serine peptidase [Acidobacteriota bacterium]|nr:S8 family serine peptidase [Acidobacteriota bacterium]MDQ5835821.1 S8 family serine peptidase [Acidobacteriota bacterium]
MNRHKFTVHLALAVALVLLAAIVGQVRRWDWRSETAPQPDAQEVAPAAADESESAESEEESGAEEESGPAHAEVLVRFRAGTTEERIAADAARLHDRVEDEIESVDGLVAVEDLNGETAEEVVRDYAALPEVEYVEPNEVIRAEPLEASSLRDRFASYDLDTGPNDPLLGEQWGLVNTGQRDGKSQADISALAAWSKTHGSQKVVVAVLDSGVDYTHPDLLNNMWHRPDDMEMYFDRQLGVIDDYDGFSALGEARDPMDENGHGTHCAGIIGAEGDNNEGIAGVNWKVEIMPLKFMGKGGFGTTKDAIEAINYVIARKADGVNVRVISASWGSRQKSRALEDVIRKAGDSDILFVAAAGNDSADADRSPHYPSGYKLPNVISVAALDRRDQLASFSNYGAKSVHLAAPGKEILSTWLDGGYEEHSGTSMATPFVAGVAALVLSVEPNLSVKELRERLLGTVDKLDSLQGKVVTGGRVNAARAVGAVR